MSGTKDGSLMHQRRPKDAPLLLGKQRNSREQKILIHENQGQGGIVFGPYDTHAIQL